MNLRNITTSFRHQQAMQEVCVFIINTNVFNYLQKNAPNSSTSALAKTDKVATNFSAKNDKNIIQSSLFIFNSNISDIVT